MNLAELLPAPHNISLSALAALYVCLVCIFLAAIVFYKETFKLSAFGLKAYLGFLSSARPSAAQCLYKGQKVSKKIPIIY